VFVDYREDQEIQSHCSMASPYEPVPDGLINEQQQQVGWVASKM